MHAGHGRVGTAGKPHGAEAEMGEKQNRRGGERDAAGPAIRGVLGDEQDRRGEDEAGGERQSPQADERGRLHHQRHRGQRIANCVPREAGEQMPAQPFGNRHCHREDEHPRPAVGPEEAGKGGAEGPEQRQTGRQDDHGKGHQPAEDVRLDEEGGADPPQAGQEEAEAEAPADDRRRHQPADEARPFRRGGAIDQPDKDREGQPEDRKGIKGRKRQRRKRAGGERDGEAAPAPGNDDQVGKGSHLCRAPPRSCAARIRLTRVGGRKAAVKQGTAETCRCSALSRRGRRHRVAGGCDGAARAGRTGAC